MRVVIAGGGTAGHVSPGLALATELAGRGHDVSFVGTERGLEASLVPAAGFEVLLLPTVPFVRTLSPAALRAPLAALRAARRCRPVVRRAASVVGMGGYASAPAVIAARRERVPVVLHEQNAIPGLANRILSRVAAAVAVSFPDAAPRFPRRSRTVVTGNPVRRAILRVREDRDALAMAAREAFGLEEGRRTVLLFGGSLGALHINMAAMDACSRLASRSDLQALVITGPAHLEAMRSRSAAAADRSIARLVGFVDRMELAYAVADLVVARAGAGTVAELSACGLPSILVPYPHALAGEQEANAQALARAGGAVVLPDGEVSGERLADLLLTLIDDPVRLEAMARDSASFGRPDAAGRLADLVESVAAR